MRINALLMDETDNVVTCVTEVQPGEEVAYRRGGEICTLTAKEAIPYCHKIALTDLAAEDEVIKYGELIGRTNAAIGKGCWVADHNIYSVPRDYDSEMV